MDWNQNYGVNISVAILDSGIDIERKEFCNKKIQKL